MKLILENWREYIKQEVEQFLPHGSVREINVIGSSTLSPEKQRRQDIEKHDYVQDKVERDVDVEVQISGITNEEVEEWAFSQAAQRLEDEGNYDVQLRIVENWRQYQLLTEAQDIHALYESGQITEGEFVDKIKRFAKKKGIPIAVALSLATGGVAGAAAQTQRAWQDYDQELRL